MPVEYKLSDDNRDMVISVVGRFDINVTRELRVIFSDRTDVNYIINMSETDHLDSSALGVLINIKKDIGDHKRISIINCNHQVKRLLLISRCDKKFDIEK